MLWVLQLHEALRLLNPRLVEKIARKHQVPSSTPPYQYPLKIHHGCIYIYFRIEKRGDFRDFNSQCKFKGQKTNKLRMKPSHNAIITGYITSSTGWIFPLSSCFFRGKTGEKTNKKKTFRQSPIIH